MTARARENVPPAHLGIVCRAVVEMFAEAGSATPVMIGEHYVSDKVRGMGSPPCVILVPEPNGGACTLDQPWETRRAAKQIHQLDVIVRAAETGDDVTRLNNAYELSDFVAAALRRVCAGKLTPGRAVGAYPTPFTVDTGAGVQLSWGVTYERDIPLDATIQALAPSAADTTEPENTGTLDTATGTVTAVP